MSKVSATLKKLLFNNILKAYFSDFRQDESIANDILLNQLHFKNPSQTIEEFDIDIALPPPPGFQDNLEEPENVKDHSLTPDQMTVVDAIPSRTNVLSSLTPDNLSQFIRKEAPKRPEIYTAKKPSKTPQRATTHKFDHSTPSSHVIIDTVETLGFSPIKNDVNIMETLKSSKANLTPLSFSKQKTSRQTIMTSTPKQKSIWNYVKPSSQCNENEEFIAKRAKSKPCIACTRLNSNQIMLISQMTNKKMANYSTVFNTDVTHMIVNVDDENCIRDYTVKFVAAVAARIWVLRLEWVQECLKNNCIVPEVSFYDLIHNFYC